MEMDLPEELREIEAALAARPLPEIANAARARILSGVRTELAIKARPERWSWWRSAAACAALFLLWLNLSISAVNCTEFRLSPGESQFDEQQALAQIQELLPDCTSEEARRELLLLRARERLIGVPLLRHAPPGVARGL